MGCPLNLRHAPIDASRMNNPGLPVMVSTTGSAAITYLQIFRYVWLSVPSFREQIYKCRIMGQDRGPISYCRSASEL